MIDQIELGIGPIGLGQIGSRLAGRFPGVGYPMVVYNRMREKAQPLAGLPIPEAVPEAERVMI